MRENRRNPPVLSLYLLVKQDMNTLCHLHTELCRIVIFRIIFNLVGHFAKSGRKRRLARPDLDSFLALVPAEYY